MANTGFKRGNSGAAGDQELEIIKRPAADKPVSKADTGIKKSNGTLSFLKNHWRKAAAAAGVMFVGTGFIQSAHEHPEHDTLSLWGMYYGVSRNIDNAKSVAGSVAQIAVVPATEALKGTGLIHPGTQPLPYAIVCTDKSLYDQMLAGDARATAFAKAVQPQLKSESHLLALKNAPFYQKNAHIDPATGAPAAVFRIPAVPKGWSPNIPYVLEAPLPVEQKFADESACGTNEVFRKSPIPGMKPAS